jgi:hypothetical protein
MASLQEPISIKRLVPFFKVFKQKESPHSIPHSTLDHKIDSNSLVGLVEVG